jgi:hypothetical protein
MLVGYGVFRQSWTELPIIRQTKQDEQEREDDVTVAMMAAILLTKGSPAAKESEDAACAAEKLYELMGVANCSPANRLQLIAWCFLPGANRHGGLKVIPSYFIYEISEGHPAVKAKSFQVVWYFVRAISQLVPKTDYQVS